MDPHGLQVGRILPEREIDVAVQSSGEFAVIGSFARHRNDIRARSTLQTATLFFFDELCDPNSRAGKSASAIA